MLTKSDVAFVLMCFAITFIALFALHAHGQTVTKNAGQLQVPSGRYAVLPDGGCTVQPDCAFVNPQVRCDSTPEEARPATCTVMRQAFNRAAATANGLGDGGTP